MTKTAKHWIDHLGLQAHPEGGFFKETYRSQSKIKHEDLGGGFLGDRNVSTAIYYLLQNDNYSAWHRIKSDEMWHFYDGTSALHIHTLTETGYHIMKLGNNPEKGEELQLVVPANTWFAASLVMPGAYALVGCTVAPGFDFADFEMASKENLLAEFPNEKDAVEQLLLG